MSHVQENCYSLHGFPDKATNISKSEVSKPKFSNEEYPRLKSKSKGQSFTHCILQKLAFLNPWSVKIHG